MKNWRDIFIGCLYGTIFLAGGVLFVAAQAVAVWQGVWWTPILFVPSGVLMSGALFLGYTHWLLVRRREREDALRREIRALEEAGLADLERRQRHAWLEALRDPPWDPRACEVEIEAKFILPLLTYLGYREENVQMRVRVPIQEGSTQTTIEADWVARDARGHALVVVEAKAPGVPLGTPVTEQARSYAFRLGAPLYMTTNGVTLEIYRRGVVRDHYLFGCATRRLRDNWPQVYEIANAAAVMDMRRELAEREDVRIAVV
jgi:hypothetical protein